jgi:hypothetical protein
MESQREGGPVALKWRLIELVGGGGGGVVIGVGEGAWVFNSRDGRLIDQDHLSCHCMSIPCPDIG